MNTPHIIRLRGPWQRTIVSGIETAQDCCTTEIVTIPSSVIDDVGPAFRGCVEYQRFFNRPTGIQETTALRLVMTQVLATHINVRLNDSELEDRIIADPEAGSFSVDVKGYLKSRNDLRVRIEIQPNYGASGLVGVVQLEIG